MTSRNENCNSSDSDERSVLTPEKLSQIIEADSLDMTGADRYALVLREPDAGPVLAASWLE